MPKHINQVEILFPEDREDLIREAVSQEETCVSVGGMAEGLGTLEVRQAPIAAPTIGSKAFAKLIEFWRRER